MYSSILAYQSHLSIPLSFEAELVMRPLVSGLRPCNEGLIHHILVFQERVVLRCWGIAYLKLCSLLSFLVSDLLNVVLVPVVYLLCLRILAFIGGPLGADLFVSLSLFQSLEDVIHIVSAVGGTWNSQLSLFQNTLS